MCLKRFLQKLVKHIFAFLKNFGLCVEGGFSQIRSHITHSVFHYTDKSLKDCHKPPPFNAMKTRQSVQNYVEFAMLLNACVIFYETKKESFKRYLSVVYASDT